MGQTPPGVRPPLHSPANPNRDQTGAVAVAALGLLNRAQRLAGAGVPDWDPAQIQARLAGQAPRIAVISGDRGQETAERVALAVWRQGGVPFPLALPVSAAHRGCSLQDRNALAHLVVSQMGALACHGALVAAGSGRAALAAAAGLAHLDAVRRRRGEAPVPAIWAPAPDPGAAVPAPGPGAAASGGGGARLVLGALGLTHPALEMAPPTDSQAAAAVAALFRLANRPEGGVRALLRQNMGNGVRVWRATGGSADLLLDLAACMIYAGFQVSLRDLDRLARHGCGQAPGGGPAAAPPDWDSLGAGEVVGALAAAGAPMDLDAMTADGTWRQRLHPGAGPPPAVGAGPPPVPPSLPGRPRVQVLEGNFFASAVARVGDGDTFDGQAYLVLYYEGEAEASRAMQDHRLLERLRDSRPCPEPLLRAIARHNGRRLHLPDAWTELDYPMLFDRMARTGALKLAVVIAGQGPEATGMPDLSAPLAHLRGNPDLAPLVAVMADGSLPGAGAGPTVGQMTPEAFRGGGILYLETGDVLLLDLQQGRADLLEPASLAAGLLLPGAAALADRGALARERLERLQARLGRVAATGRLLHCTDASQGVVPLAVAAAAAETATGP